jgi:hypothetical protein
LKKILRQSYIRRFTKVLLPWTDVYIPLDQLFINLVHEFNPQLTLGEVMPDFLFRSPQPNATSIPTEGGAGADGDQPDADFEGTSPTATASTSATIQSDTGSDSEAENEFEFESDNDNDTEKEAPGTKVDFHKFEDLLKKEIENDQNCIIITGTGGIGKTTMSKMFCLNWANKKHFRQLKAVVRLELKKDFSKDDLIAGMIDQYGSVLSAEFSEEELKRVENILKSGKDSLVWILDGFDESSSNGNARKLVKKLFDPEAEQVTSSTVVLYMYTPRRTRRSKAKIKFQHQTFRRKGLPEFHSNPVPLYNRVNT